MRHFKLQLLLLVSLTGFVQGCRLVEEPLPVPPEVEQVHGHVIAGKARSNMTQVNGGGTVSQPYAGTMQWQYALSPNVKLTFSSQSSSNGPSSNRSVSLSGTAGMVEFVGEAVADSFMVCYAVNADTTAGSILRYNTQSGSPCQGQAYLESVGSKNRPTQLPFGMRIDSASHWVADFVNLTGDDFEYRSGGSSNLQVNNHYAHAYWGDEVAYLGFRWRDGGNWRYGYVQFRVTSTYVILTGYATE